MGSLRNSRSSFGGAFFNCTCGNFSLGISFLLGSRFTLRNCGLTNLRSGDVSRSRLSKLGCFSTFLSCGFTNSGSGDTDFSLTSGLDTLRSGTNLTGRSISSSDSDSVTVISSYSLESSSSLSGVGSLAARLGVLAGIDGDLDLSVDASDGERDLSVEATDGDFDLLPEEPESDVPTSDRRLDTGWGEAFFSVIMGTLISRDCSFVSVFLAPFSLGMSVTLLGRRGGVLSPFASDPDAEEPSVLSVRLDDHAGFAGDTLSRIQEGRCAVRGVVGPPIGMFPRK